MPDVWYVYAITEAAALADLWLPPGIADVRPEPVVAAGGLAAVAAQVDDARLDSAGADDAMKAHDRVVQEIFFQGVPVLPLRFGVVHPGRAGVVSQLVTQRSWMRAELDRVRDAAQWSVRVGAEAWLERQMPRETLAFQATRIYDGRIYLVRRMGVPAQVSI